MNIFNEITNDLQQVQSLLRKNFTFKAGHLNQFVPMDFNYLDMNLRPAVIIATSRLFGAPGTKTTALAAVIQFIFMAARIHSGVKEGSSNKNKTSENRSGFQYPVLVGDYLYGKFFTTLCEFGLVKYLRNLAELICTINKNGIQTINNNTGMELGERPHYLDVIRDETAVFFATGAFLCADLAGAKEEHKEILHRFGLDFGMAYGLLERGLPVIQVKEYLKAAEVSLLSLPPENDIRLLKNLLDFLGKENIVQRMVG